MPRLASVETCTGCSACQNICPHSAICMKEDFEGFLIPSIDRDKCVECKLCEKACPIVNGRKDDLKNDRSLEVLALWSYPDRTLSSSGGAFSAISRVVFNDDGVVFGAAWHDGFDCHHTSANNISELNKLRGSKYVQSSIEDTYNEVKKILKSGKMVLFSGTPCQVAGLKSFLMKPYENLVCVDIVCHGVPSNRLFSNYIEKLKKEYPKYSGALGLGFRRLNGWGIAPSVKTPKSKVYLTGVPNIYMQAFDKAAIFRKSCYDCQFNGINRVGDITIADFWGIGKLGKSFRHDVTKGVSLVLVNNQKGLDVINQLKDCFIEKRTIEEAIPLNHNLVGSSPINPSRSEIIEAFNNPQMSLYEINKKLKLTNGDFKTIIKDFLNKMGIFFIVKSAYNKLMILR